jgi:RNA polymerase sigma-70 factor (ECF subfamily)
MEDALIRAKCEGGEVDAAATLLLEAHGREVMLFLVNRTDDQQLASDAFAQFAEDLWRGLPSFAQRGSLRSWVFTLAHHALMRLGRVRQRDGRRHVHAFATSGAFELAQRMRTETLPYLRSDVREGVARLRARLSDEDQLLLELRVGRRFSWKDIARITLGGPEDVQHAQDVPPAELEREAARLRKRFELVKKQLRSWAEREGLVPDPTSR